MRLILMRHAQPLIAKAVCYGQLDVDVDLAANQVAAQRLRQFLALSERTAPRIVCSALRRTQVLAQQLASHFPSAHLQQDARLNEMNFGCWEGVAWDLIPRSELDAWTAQFGTHAFGGEESCNQVITRVANAYDELQHSHLDHAQDVVWITHAGVIRALSYYLETGNREIHHVKDWPLFAPNFGEWDIRVLRKLAEKQE